MTLLGWHEGIDRYRRRVGDVFVFFVGTGRYERTTLGLNT